MKNTPLIEAIMTAYAERTGLTIPTNPPRRYLWTDAFALCNYLELHRRTSESRFLEIALALVQQVHHTLGRHRNDDPRQGWISGLNEDEGELHPTKGGLRIGKKLPERKPNEPFNETLEWERDGQYFHYLTKWMHALNHVTRLTGDTQYNRWAIELAQSAHAAFTYTPDLNPLDESHPQTSPPKRMLWKMSIDLSYPLIPSMGHHDPLDGLITYRQIQATARATNTLTESLNLQTEIAEMNTMCQGTSWQTNDPLGIGGLLMDSCSLAQVMVSEDIPGPELLAFLLEETETSLHTLAQSRPLEKPVNSRLAFRELGLSIGLHALEQIKKTIDQHPGSFPHPQTLTRRLSRLEHYLPWAQEIEQLWLTPENQKSSNWQPHEDINSVMLATSLAPESFLS